MNRVAVLFASLAGLSAATGVYRSSGWCFLNSHCDSGEWCDYDTYKCDEITYGTKNKACDLITTLCREDLSLQCINQVCTETLQEVIEDRAIGDSPTARPTRRTRNPTKEPTPRPTRSPTAKRTRRPTKQPTFKPLREGQTHRPTREPTMKPTRRPTKMPSFRPTRQPTERPTRRPVRTPTQKPLKEGYTQRPTRRTRRPTKEPTFKPTRQPTDRPTRRPTPMRPTVATAAPTLLKPAECGACCAGEAQCIGMPASEVDGNCCATAKQCCRHSIQPASDVDDDDYLCCGAGEMCLPDLVAQVNECRNPATKSPTALPTTMQPTSLPTIAPTRQPTPYTQSPTTTRTGCAVFEDCNACKDERGCTWANWGCDDEDNVRESLECRA